MKQQNFFSRNDEESINALNNIFKPNPSDKYIWFIEHCYTHEWLSEDSDHVCLDFDFPTPHNPNGDYIMHGGIKMKKLYSDHQLTIDPLKAKQFKKQIDALMYIISKRMGGKFIVTEHEFI